MIALRSVGRLAAWLGGLALAAQLAAADAPRVEFKSKPDAIDISIGGRHFATYVSKDAKIAHPYFCDVYSPGGVRLTRNNPPVPDKDLVDHDTVHPGIWMSFGDLNGTNFWLSKGKVTQEKFVEEPKGGEGQGTFTVLNSYLPLMNRAGKPLPQSVPICHEICRFTISVRPGGYLLTWDSEFTPDVAELVFGDEEEMGVGFRMATPLAEKQQGRIINSDGLRGAEQAWAKLADWCDYGGTIDGRYVGLVLMPSPANFRRSWFHVRDTGLSVGNPFGVNAFTQGKRSRIVVKQGKTLKLAYGVLAYDADSQEGIRAAEAYQDYLRRIGGK